MTPHLISSQVGEKKLANVEKAHRLYGEFGGRSDGEEAEDFQASVVTGFIEHDSSVMKHMRAHHGPSDHS